MQELISNLQTSIEVYRNFGKTMLLLTALLSLFLIKLNQKGRIIVFYVIIASIIILNPIYIKQEIVFLGEHSIYRLGMLLLIPIISSYALTSVLFKVSEKKKKRIAIVGIIILLAASGRFVYTKEHFFLVKNDEKVYDLAVDIANCVTATNQSPTVAISEVQGVFIRQYDANIKLVCAPEVRENWEEAEDESVMSIRIMLSDSNPDMPNLAQLAKQLGCDYLILLTMQTKEDSPQNYGFKYVNTFEDFQVFENLQE